MRIALAWFVSIVLAACTSSNGNLGGGQSWNGSAGGSGSGGGWPSGGSGAASDSGGGSGAMDASQQPQPPPMEAGTTSTACMAPADCMQGQVCCGKLDLLSVNQQCTINTFMKACDPNCPTMVMLTCQPQQVRVCAASTDCTETGIGKCCTFGFGMKTATFCVDDTVAAFATTCN